MGLIKKPPNQSEPNRGPRPYLVYDVFLSSVGRGNAESMRYTKCLYYSLEKAGFSVFWDYAGGSFLGDDHHIFLQLLQIIQRARVSVAVLSTASVASPRNLELLELMLECRRNAGQFILPVFLGVTPRDIREAFADFTKRISEKDKVECWKVTLAQICQIQSYQWVYLNNNHQWSDNDMHIRNVVEHVGGLLNGRNLFVAEYQVEVGYRVQEATKLLVHSKSKEVLLLGIWGMEQLNALCGSSEWFGPGSMIIVTTRDRSLLQDHRVDHVYTMKEMKKNKSLELFNWYVFKKAANKQYLDELSKIVVAYAGGLPLALEVLGSKLLGSLDSIPDGLIDSPHPVLQKVLKKCVKI
ncbi:hypothetical protein PIB30_055886 [Stylosanthes scabra]|uniref:TIR domain-containing protein n=1 Tax=Stylosanthes scabra TaxID=79078 RepID=A0ABU6XHV6_9FABA|nr:hypothetical protein [Stylosanthes scabra]